jgi:DNA-binding transcriptional MerR regulator
VQKNGGRRYYRPADVALLQAIQKLLYVDGYTIRGVQKLIRDKTARGVISLAANSGLRAGLDVESDAPDQTGRSLVPQPKRVSIVPSLEPPRRVKPGPPGSAGFRFVLSVLGEPARRADLVSLPAPTGDHAGAVPIASLQIILEELAECERILAAARLGIGDSAAFHDES